MALYLSLLFQARHASKQCRVVLGAVHASVNASVAIRAKPYYERGMIRPAIADASDMMGLQIVAAVTTHKWGRSATTLADAPGAGQHIISNVGASLVNRSRFAAHLCIANTCGCVSQVSETVQVINDRRCRFHLLDNFFDVSEAEHDDLSRIAVGISALSPLEALANHLSNEEDIPLWIAFVEQQQRPTIGRMISDGPIPTDVQLIAALPFAEVEHGPVFEHFVVVAILRSTGTGHYEDDVMSWDRNDPRLLASPKTSVNILASVIRSPFLEAVAHQSSPKLVPVNDTGGIGDSPPTRAAV
ncbi:hypothetical protein VE26_05385 [Devosia chinhatensis]|uniref:Uncharacterized protein n=1 Tax=Devosia chinhatensis TaxID=429727 RepID=A0A0F5FKE9_9HYPH|nr:hypothetical protein VE26_05385 [Devosia chinhatensis]